MSLGGVLGGSFVILLGYFGVFLAFAMALMLASLLVPSFKKLEAGSTEEEGTHPR